VAGGFFSFRGVVTFDIQLTYYTLLSMCPWSVGGALPKVAVLRGGWQTWRRLFNGQDGLIDPL
jgi:hypothetical protein